MDHAAAAHTAPLVRVMLTPDELHSLARWIERNSTTAEADGQATAAETLFWRVAALREAMR